MTRTYDEEHDPNAYVYRCGHSVTFRSAADHARNGQNCPVCAVDSDTPIIETIVQSMRRPTGLLDQHRHHAERLLDDLRDAGYEVIDVDHDETTEARAREVIRTFLIRWGYVQGMNNPGNTVQTGELYRALVDAGLIRTERTS